MTVWNVSELYESNGNVRYTILPYNLIGTIKNYIKYDKMHRLIKFLLNCRLTENHARKYADKKTRKINKT